MGKNGAGKSTLLKMVAGALAPDEGTVKLGASLAMGYFAQQSLDVLDPDLTIEEQLQKDFPQSRSARCATSPARSSSRATTSTRRSAMLSAARRRAGAWRACCSTRRTSSSSTSRPTISISRRRRCCSRRCSDFEGTMLFVSHDREFLRGLSTACSELGGESGVEAQPTRIPGTYEEYVARTGHEAPGVHR
jgi:ATPase subunit of ABC transporter with duplicated ATPase domains